MAGSLRHPVETQRALARLLRLPAAPLMSHVREANPAIPDLHRAVFDSARELIESHLSTKLRPGSMIDPPPTLIDRMTFCWLLLRNAEQAIKKLATKDIPLFSDPPYLRGVFDLLPGTPLDDSLIQEICSALALGPKGDFLSKYNEFLRAQKSKNLNIPLMDRDRNPQLSNLRRIIRWIIRKRREQYVDATRGDAVEINLPFLLDKTLYEVGAWCGPSSKSIPGINEEAENEINRWIEYSCLEGPSTPSDEEERLELARAFVKANKLKIPVYVPERSRSPGDEARIRELEKEISRYATENKTLEDAVAALRAQLAAATTQQASAPQPPGVIEPALPALRPLQSALKMLDSKYSLDVLHALHLGEPSSLTLKNFLGHLFYVLRKTGLCQYPEATSFNVRYDESGLYDCVGFEVPPDHVCRVALIKPGWAIRDKEKLLPIRKAQVKAAD